MNQVVKQENIIISWVVWHFYQMTKFLFSVFGNYISFGLDYFSIPLLLATLLSPWRQYRWKYPRGFDLGEYLNVFISNIFSRIIGLLCRLVLIIFGLAMLAVILVLGAIGIVFWIIIPVILVGLLAVAYLYSWLWMYALATLLVLLGWHTYWFITLKVKKREYLIYLPDVISHIQDYTITDFLSLEGQTIVKNAISISRKRRLESVTSEAVFYAAIEESREIKSLLFRLGIDYKKLHTDLKNYLEKLPKGPLEDRQVKKSNPVLSESFQKVLLGAAKLAAERQKKEIGAKELLVALAKDDAFFEQVLVTQDLKEKDIENITLWLDTLENQISQSKKFWTKENLARAGSLGRGFASGYTVTLDQFSIDWGKVFGQQLFSEIIGHQKEIDELEVALDTFSLHNALIIGEVGVGRKSLVQALAKRCWLRTGSPTLAGKRVVELDMVALLSQIQSQEKVESVLDEIFKEVQTAGNVILVVDELDHFVSHSTFTLGEIDISTILSKYLKMPNFQFIGITSFDGLHRKLEQNPSFLEYFRKIEVQEISEIETIRVLQNLALEIEHREKILVLYPSIREVVNLSGRYFPSTPFPKKAIDILQEAVVYVKSLKEKIILPHHIAKIISDKTQIPVGKMEFKEKSVLLNLENLIHERIINQSEAVADISMAMRRARSGLESKKRPMGTFLFMGPTGVGKTETAKALADIYFGGVEKMIRLDMSEFQAVADIPRLLGAVSPVEVQGLLTTPVRENPFSLVLLDEIEKAHPNILNLFLQVFDEGHITDGQGRKVMFTNTIIIATSNAGAAEIFKATELGHAVDKNEFLSFLFEKGHFSPEFINRFDATVIFHPLTKENLMGIAQLTLASLVKNLKEKDIEFVISEALKTKIVELSYKPEFGARQMRRVVQDNVESSIAEALLSDQLIKGEKFEINSENFKVVKLG